MTKDVLILVAEDDDGHFALIERNLTRFGGVTSDQIVRFKDGQAVLDFLEDAKSPVCVDYGCPVLLLDVRMPKVDGIEVLTRIKADRLLRHIPAIIMSTTADSKIIDKCKRLGCCMYVTKPVEYENFVRSIQEVCSYLSNLQVPPLSGS